MEADFSYSVSKYTEHIPTRYEPLRTGAIFVSVPEETICDAFNFSEPAKIPIPELEPLSENWKPPGLSAKKPPHCFLSRGSCFRSADKRSEGNFPFSQKTSKEIDLPSFFYLAVGENPEIFSPFSVSSSPAGRSRVSFPWSLIIATSLYHLPPSSFKSDLFTWGMGGKYMRGFSLLFSCMWGFPGRGFYLGGDFPNSKLSSSFLGSGIKAGMRI